MEHPELVAGLPDDEIPVNIYFDGFDWDGAGDDPGDDAGSPSVEALLERPD